MKKALLIILIAIFCVQAVDSFRGPLTKDLLEFEATEFALHHEWVSKGVYGNGTIYPIKKYTYNCVNYSIDFAKKIKKTFNVDLIKVDGCRPKKDEFGYKCHMWVRWYPNCTTTNLKKCKIYYDIEPQTGQFVNYTNEYRIKRLYK